MKRPRIAKSAAADCWGCKSFPNFGADVGTVAGGQLRQIGGDGGGGAVAAAVHCYSSVEDPQWPLIHGGMRLRMDCRNNWRGLGGGKEKFALV